MKPKNFLPKVLFIFCVLLAGGLLFAHQALAIDTGLNETAKVAGFETGAGSTDIARRVGQIINSVLSLIGVIFLILMIYAGILWMTAAGNEDQVKKAKDMIKGAIIGIAIIFGAYSITNFVITTLLTQGQAPAEGGEAAPQPTGGGAGQQAPAAEGEAPAPPPGFDEPPPPEEEEETVQCEYTDDPGCPSGVWQRCTNGLTGCT